MKFAPYIACMIIGILFAGYWSCNSSKNKKAEDKLKVLAQENEILRQKKSVIIPASDSMSRVYKAERDAARDSVKQLTALQDDAKDNISASNTRIKNLIDLAHDYAVKIKDTSLQSEVAKFKAMYYNQESQAVKFYEAGRKKDSICATEMTRSQFRLDAKDTVIHRLERLFDSAQVVSHGFETMAIKYVKKANKRFSVGPHLGITYDGQFKPSYGVSIQYTLFKF